MFECYDLWVLVRDYGFDALGMRLRKVSWFLPDVRFWAFALRGAAWDTAFLPIEDAGLAGTTYYATLAGDLVLRTRREDGPVCGALLLSDDAVVPTTPVGAGGVVAHTKSTSPTPRWTTRSVGTPHVGVGIQLRTSGQPTEPRSEEQSPKVVRAATALWEAAMRFGHDVDAGLAMQRGVSLLEALEDVLGRDVVAPTLAKCRGTLGRTDDTANLEERRTLRALDRAMSRLHEAPTVAEMALAVGVSSRSIERRVRDHGTQFGARALTARAELRRWRTFTACAALSASDTPRLDDLSRATGFGSATALCHAFTRAGIDSPHALARRARAERDGRSA